MRGSRVVRGSPDPALTFLGSPDPTTVPSPLHAILKTAKCPTQSGLNTRKPLVMERYRITPDAAVYYMTYSIVEWLPVFTSEVPCHFITESLNYCHQHKGLRINTFVIMPTHLHAIVFSSDFRSEPLAAALTEFRKFTGRQLSDYCQQTMPACFCATLSWTAPSSRSSLSFAHGLVSRRIQLFQAINKLSLAPAIRPCIP